MLNNPSISPRLPDEKSSESTLLTPSADENRSSGTDVLDRHRADVEVAGAGYIERPPATNRERIAVVIPCHNEEVAIPRVVSAFAGTLPHAQIYVYDNNSTDATAAVARAAGAIVRREPLQGKGHVVRRMFADVEADAYVLVDGDDTYDASVAADMVRLLFDDRLDMVTVVLVSAHADCYRYGHRFGNALLTGIVSAIFGTRTSDMLSGYRVFSRRFVKSFPALAAGFEIETEFTVHALALDMPIADIPTAYRERPHGSSSKLRTWSDGLIILRAIVVLVKEERPLMFFSCLALVAVTLGILIGIPIIVTFINTGLVPRLPSAVLATGLVLVGSLLEASALILDSVARARKEARRLAYLSVPAPSRRGA